MGAVLDGLEFRIGGALIHAWRVFRRRWARAIASALAASLMMVAPFHFDLLEQAPQWIRSMSVTAGFAIVFIVPATIFAISTWAMTLPDVRARFKRPAADRLKQFAASIFLAALIGGSIPAIFWAIVAIGRALDMNMVTVVLSLVAILVILTGLGRLMLFVPACSHGELQLRAAAMASWRSTSGKNFVVLGYVAIAIIFILAANFASFAIAESVRPWFLGPALLNANLAIAAQTYKLWNAISLIWATSITSVILAALASGAYHHRLAQISAAPVEDIADIFS